MTHNPFPAGKYEKPDPITSESLRSVIDRLREFPDTLEALLSGLGPDHLETKTLPGFWSITQVVHHLADSHMNAFIRTKLALTESHPTIKPYAEEKWALLSDSKQYPIQASLMILKGVHERWAHLLVTLDDSDIQKSYFHPESKETFRVGEVAPMYEWHGRHHAAFIEELIREKQWSSGGS